MGKQNTYKKQYAYNAGLGTLHFERSIEPLVPKGRLSHLALVLEQSTVRTSQPSMLKAGFLLLLALALTACGATKQTTSLDQGKPTGRQASRASTTAGTGQGCEYPCVPIFANTETDFLKAIMGLLDSANFGSQIGEVRMSDGASIGMSLKFEEGFVMGQPNSGLLIASGSSLQIVVRDRVNGQPMPPIQITFDGRDENVYSEGLVDEDTIEALFSDDYGDVWIEATVSGTLLVGTISFENYRSISGNTPAKSENVLKFQIPVCQAVECGATGL